MIRISTLDETDGLESVRREALVELAERRVRQGLAPPAEIYRIENRRGIDWSEFPAWARPVDPQVFDGCCHEG
jgi:hypothetical protein